MPQVERQLQSEADVQRFSLGRSVATGAGPLAARQIRMRAPKSRHSLHPPTSLRSIAQGGDRNRRCISGWRTRRHGHLASQAASPRAPIEAGGACPGRLRPSSGWRAACDARERPSKSGERRRGPDPRPPAAGQARRRQSPVSAQDRRQQPCGPQERHRTQYR